MAKGKMVRYHPSDENRLWLIKKQADYVKDHPSVGLDRILDMQVTKLRKQEADGD